MTREEMLMGQAVNKWGRVSQLDMVIEECAELINAIQKRKRNRVSDADVLEEGVDVELCIEQLKLILDDSIRWESIRIIKLNRLEGLLNDH